MTLVLVTGPPASGKTTLARAIATELGWPLYTKGHVAVLDEVKRCAS